MELWCEAHDLFWSIVIVVFQRQHDAPGSHGPGVVVAAFDLVPGIVFGGAISVVDPFYHRESFFEHIVVDHAGCYLVFAAGPHLVAVANAFFTHMRRERPGTNEETGFPGACVGSFGWVYSVLSGYVGRPVVFPDRSQGLIDVVFRIDIADMIEPGPGLAEQLVAEAALRILVRGVFFEIDILNKIASVPQAAYAIGGACGGNGIVLFFESCILHGCGQGGGGFEAGEIESAYIGIGAIESDVKGVGL